MLRPVLRSSRFLVLAAVLGALVAAFALFAYGVAETLVVIVVLAVLFLGFVVSWDGSRNQLPIGAAIAMVIAALSYFLSTVKGGKG
jgi:uncharacterized membrane protein YqhA